MNLNYASEGVHGVKWLAEMLSEQSLCGRDITRIAERTLTTGEVMNSARVEEQDSSLVDGM